MRVLLCLWAAAIAVALAIFSGTTIQAAGEGPEEIFFKATQAQKEGQFEKAAEGYGNLLQSGYVGGHVLYNLGNAHIRLNQLGMAILQYERARALIPRDADLQFNLEYARNLTQDAIPASKGFIGHTLFWLDSFNCSELLWSFAALNVLFWTALFVRLFYRSEWFYYLFVLVLVCWFISGISFGAKWYQVEYDDRAVILEKEVGVLAGPHQGDTVLFKLHEGAMVHEERVDDGWMLIHLPDRKRGWIPSEDAARIKASGFKGEKYP